MDIQAMLARLRAGRADGDGGARFVDVQRYYKAMIAACEAAGEPEPDVEALFKEAYRLALGGQEGQDDGKV